MAPKALYTHAMTAVSPADPPFGALAPNPLQAALIALVRAAPARGLGRLITSPVRRLLMASLSGPIDVETLGFKARLDPRDNLSDKRAALIPAAFDAAERAVLADAITPGFVFIDAGANTGLYSLFVAARAGPAARIVAIEPQPGVKERLAFNIAANGFADRIRVVACALAEGPGEAILHLPGHNRGQASLQGDGAGVAVPTAALMAVMEEAGVTQADALKIDIEGAEERVLPAFFAACPKHRLPKLLLMERNPGWATDCVGLAQAAGYRIVLDVGRNVVLRRH